MGIARPSSYQLASASFLGITEDTQLEVTTDGKSLVLTPAQSGRQVAAFEKARKGFFSDSPASCRALMALSK